LAGGAIRDSTRVSGSRRQRILLEPMIAPSRTPSDLMANERDAQGHMICPVCGEVIRTPDLSPFVGDQRAHEKCWSSPFRLA
jgi:hypothetical protein